MTRLYYSGKNQRQIWSYGNCEYDRTLCSLTKSGKKAPEKYKRKLQINKQNIETLRKRKKMKADIAS